MIRIQGLTKNQMNEVERITLKLKNWEAYIRVEEGTIRSIIIDTLLEYKDIDSQDKNSRRNMQIKELKKQLKECRENLKAMTQLKTFNR